jgi:FlaA1/EpsC-like NDP-sugar epimerase
VTHPEVTRYFMTIPEACQLILQAASVGVGGEVFVLDMGEPVAINYLARQMILLSGKTPGVDVEIVHTGLRPGEKLFEELFHESEALRQSEHPKLLLARFREVDWNMFERDLESLEAACAAADEGRVRALLSQLVPEFRGAAPGTGESKVVPIGRARQ